MLNTSPVLEFKSSTFFAPILILFKNDIAAIELALQEKVNLAPEFFKDSPLIIDLRELNKQNLDLDFTQIASSCCAGSVFFRWVSGAAMSSQNKQARALFIPIDTAARARLVPGIDWARRRKPEAAQQPALSQPETTDDQGANPSGLFRFRRWPQRQP
jgi:septum site-determining protein MinC